MGLRLGWNWSLGVEFLLSSCGLIHVVVTLVSFGLLVESFRGVNSYVGGCVNFDKVT